jgi:hypothetical protein
MWEPKENLLYVTIPYLYFFKRHWPYCIHRTCLDLLTGFNQCHNITVQKPPSLDSGNKTSRARGCPGETIQLSWNIDWLTTLLDVPQLQGELRDLVEARVFTKTKAYFANSDINSMVSTWTNHNHVHSMLGSYISVLSDDQCSAADLFLYWLLHSVQILPSLVSSSQKLATLLNAQHWEMCWSLMVVFNWYCDTGLRTVKSVLSIHCEKGYKQLKSQSPMLADFIDHIWFVYHEQKSWLEGKKVDMQKRQKRNT